MAPASKDTTVSAGGDEKFDLAKQAFKCTNGIVDFDMPADMIGSPNGEAARKKFKCVFEKDEVPLNIIGSTLNNGTDGASAVKSTRTPKGKASTGKSALDPASTPKTTSSARKCKATETKEESSHETDEEEVSATPKKRSKTPRSPKAPRIPRAPRTPKGTTKVEIGGGFVIDLEDNDGHKERTGSPEVQAKADGIVKRNEKATDGKLGDIEKQVIHDAVEKDMATNTEEQFSFCVRVDA